MKLKIKEAIVVEGKYDVHKLRQIFDGIVIKTNGFSLFKDKEKQYFVRKLAEERGIIILTDSDGAGLVIRNYLKGILPAAWIKQAYIPQISGKERRKACYSKEGFLGVEGMEARIIIDAVRNAGATFFLTDKDMPKNEITKSDLFQLGLSGAPNSTEQRKKVLRALKLPQNLSSNAMLQYINTALSTEEFLSIVRKTLSK